MEIQIDTNGEVCRPLDPVGLTRASNCRRRHGGRSGCIALRFLPSLLQVYLPTYLLVTNHREDSASHNERPLVSSKSGVLSLQFPVLSSVLTSCELRPCLVLVPAIQNQSRQHYE